MLRSLRSDIYDIPVPQLGPETWAPLSPELRQIMTPQLPATVAPAPGTLLSWLHSHQTEILIGSAVLLGVVLVRRIGRR